MDSRAVPLRLGDIGWLFPTLTDPADSDRVGQLLGAAEGAFHPLGRWQMHTTVSLRCDSAGSGCGRGHLVDARTGPLAETPVAAAVEVGAATAWLLQRLANETEESLRGHPRTPQRLD